MSRLKTIQWANSKVVIIDQTLLPTKLSYIDVNNIEEMWDAIKKLKIRGAPAIGIATAFGLYLGMKEFPENGSTSDFISLFNRHSRYLESCRPTAVNLLWALKRIRRKIDPFLENSSIGEIKNIILNDAISILDEDNRDCRKIGENGFEILKKYNTLLTHCNAGGLATGEFGTALAPIYIGQEHGKLFHVYADETRPLLQGARITAFELKEAGIDVTIICDNMAATVMAQGKIDAVIVGSDRIAANGDAANKIGTYGVALLAKAHSLPFYVAAPFSTFDLTLKSGKEIPIEDRDGSEVIKGFNTQTGPDDVKVYNPAFDVTPFHLITAHITEKGVIYPPFEKAIKELA
ncbi:MAG: S-methyl-5-thioribose-1-phosphate isomerase [Chitinispirillia bacterium]|jgi:methylthioribose-1-phosphate isomerase